ncbi:hypothetical protein ACQ4PT_017317 [Festuca glaucescens]
MSGQNGDERVRCRDLLIVLLIAVLVAVMCGGLYFLVEKTDWRDHSQPPQYSISITGVAGLDVDDVAGDRHPTLSPVFNLTLRISNTRDEYQACVPELSMASVFYGDAFLGKGSVGAFCAEAKGEREGRARVWGQDVALPRFLRDQLAGELQRGDAAVDVVLKMPSGCNMVSCFDTVLICKARIRGGPPSLMSVSVVKSQH